MAAKTAGSGRAGILRRFLGITRQKGGFTLIEVMIVVAIIGILCAVAIPLYISFVNRARIVSHIYPGLHAIETNIAAYYASNGVLPSVSEFPGMLGEANTDHFNVAMLSDRLKITVDSSQNMKALNGMVMYAKPLTSNMQIIIWSMSGTLAEKLGIND